MEWSRSYPRREYYDRREGLAAGYPPSDVRFFQSNAVQCVISTIQNSQNHVCRGRSYDWLKAHNYQYDFD